MNKVLGVFSLLAVASVSAGHLVFNKGLLGGHADLVKVLHGAHVDGGNKLRFLFLVPKVGGGVNGFKTGAAEKALDLLNLEAGHHFLGLLGFSDCKNWHGGLLAFWNGADVVEKPFADGAALTGGVDALVDFLGGKMVAAGFNALWPLLPAHHLVFKLHGKFAAL